MSSGEKRFRDGDDYRVQQDMERRIDKQEGQGDAPGKKALAHTKLSNRVDKKEKMTLDQIAAKIKKFDPATQLKPDSLINVVSPRRAGKTVMVEYLL